MDYEKTLRIDRLASQLAETLMTAASCAKELRSEVLAEIDENCTAQIRQSRSAVDGFGRRPLLSECTLIAGVRVIMGLAEISSGSAAVSFAQATNLPFIFLSCSYDPV